MVESAARSRYPRDKIGACSSRDGRGDGVGGIRGRESVGYGSSEGGRMKLLEEPDNIRRVFDREVINVAHNPMGAVSNTPLASDPDK